MANEIPSYESFATEAGVAADIASRLGVVEELFINDDVDKKIGQFVAVPQGRHLESIKKFIDEYRTAPERRQGTASFSDLDSFIAHAKRFADADSALFANPLGSSPTLTSVLDYHCATAKGAPRFGKHRGLYEFPLSDEWKAWRGKHSQGMNQATFAEFLEEHLIDVLDPAVAGETAKALAGTLGVTFATPAKLLELSRGLSIRVGSTLKSASNLQTGEMQVQFESAHTDERGTPLKVPGAFVVGIAVFKNGAPYQLPVRLRYRLKNNELFWFFELYRHDAVFDHAFKESCAKARAGTGLPLFFGTPEA